MTIRTDLAANSVADLAAAFAAGENPLAVTADHGFPGEIRTEDGDAVLVAGAHAVGGGLLLGCYVVEHVDAHGYPVAAWDLDQRGLVPRRVVA